MAANIPDGLKSADIAQFAIRGAQLEKFKPIISYWCDFCMVNRILNKGLHTEGDDCMAYTTNLMDKLERVKQEHPDDTIHDEVAAKAYIEQFALETFDRADNAVSANKASAQTADTYRAAATFLELLGIWPPLDPEITAKIKYAKYHALRIAKAIKAGEDPNASNPAPGPEPAIDSTLDPNDPDVQSINNAASLQPRVEDAPGSSSASPTLINPPPAPAPTHAPPNNVEVSPLETSPNTNSRANSVGGGYFPPVPTFTSEPSAPSLPTAPPDDMSMKRPSQEIDPRSFYDALAPTAPSTVNSAGSTPAAPLIPSRPPPEPSPVPPPVAVSAAAPVMAGINQGSYRTDDESVMNAQKHARWAISALNFEDVNTAVKELKIALQTLGAR